MPVPRGLTDLGQWHDKAVVFFSVPRPGPSNGPVHLRQRLKMTQQSAHKAHWIAAKDVQPEDIQGPFDVRMRVDPPPGLDFWDHPLWIYGRSEGQNAGEGARLALTQHAEHKDGSHRHEGWPLKILYPILIDFAKDNAADHLVLKIDLRNLEVRPTGTGGAATAIKAERSQFPELAGHARGWKSH